VKIFPKQIVGKINYRYIYGPLPFLLCQGSVFVINVISMIVFLLYAVLSALRYLFIFYLKDPAYFQDDFWSGFLIVWIVSASIIPQVAYTILNERPPIITYICAGLQPGIYFIN